MGKDNYISKNYKETDLAYFAGIIDGEGAITIHNASKNGKVHFNTAIRVASTDEVLIDWLSNTFGSPKLKYTKKQTPKNSRRPIFNWQITGKRLEDVCRLIRPYLVIKIKEVDIMLKARSTFNSNYYIKGQIGNHNLTTRKLSEEGLKIRNECVKALRDLHCRGYVKSNK